MGFKSILKSWTINANTILGSVVTICSILGHPVDPRLVAEIFTLLKPGRT